MRTRATLAAAIAAAVTMLAAVPAQAQDCAGADGVPSAQGPSATRAAIRCLVNQERAARGLAPLGAEGRLKKAAELFAARMVRDQFFSHVAPDGRTLLQRLRATKYVTKKLKRFSIAENLGYGTGELASPRAIVAGWLDSTSHRRNMLDKRFKQIGIGIADGSPFGDDDARTIVADFGVRVR